MSEAGNVSTMRLIMSVSLKYEAGVVRRILSQNLCLNLVLETMKFYCIFSSVADLGSGAIFTPRSGIRDG